MAYTKNPNLPRVRGQAVELIRRGKSTREVGRHFGFNQSTIVRWMKKARQTWGYGLIPTLSSRPKKHPRSLSREVVEAIIKERIGRRRCAEHVHHALKKHGVIVSLSSVKRTLDRCGLRKKRSPWKRPHDYTERPEPAFVGALVEVDTILIIAPDGSRIYVYTLIDLFSRWAYAEVVEKIGVVASVEFIGRAKQVATFSFEPIQTDHGSEFSIWFTHALTAMKIKHRHSRVGQKDDQAHIERFNRTIQEECLDRIVHSLDSFKLAVPKFLHWYNTERTHMGINYQTPLEVMQRS
ncbi:MAG: integrase core domain-containing protein [Patescibacteria group bacterium]